MHLPDGIIPLYQCIIYWIITIICMFILRKFTSCEKEQNIVYIAIFTVLTFTLSSLSFPSPFGVPIHFFIIPLIVIIFGPVTGCAVSFFSLLGQFLILNMGGITVLGANFIVMGLILSVITYLIYRLFLEINEKLAIFVGTIIGIMSATFTQVIILLLSGTVNFNVILSTLIPFYLFISIMEGILNIMFITTISKIKPEIMST